MAPPIALVYLDRFLRQDDKLLSSLKLTALGIPTFTNLLNELREALSNDYAVTDVVIPDAETDDRDW